MAERVDVGGVDLAYTRSGEGPVVVFVHGLGGSKEAWGDVAGTIAAAGYDAIAIDMRGAGESEAPPGPYSVEGWASDLIAALASLRIDQAALVGHSVGCMVVEHAALALAERCSALAMLGGAIRWAEGFEDALTERAGLARAGRLREVAGAVATTGFTERAHAERPELIREFVERFSANDPDGYAESALATARGTMIEPERIQCPALAFAGGDDAVGPPQAAKEIAAAMPRGEFSTVPGGAHWCQVELSELVSERLLDFLRTAGPG